AMVASRPDWCLSRQRTWGVPIPSIRSKKSGDSILDVRIIDEFMKLVAEKGSDAWFDEPLSAFWPEGFVYEPTGEDRPEDFEKEHDILDVWFDSGASHVAVLERDPRLSSPADLYLEGSDQHRGWFQTSLLTSIGARRRAPYRAVLTHGYVLDGKGKAMSKSAGNVISPLDVADRMGADVLRLWVCSENYRNDVAVSDEILSRISEAYRRIRNAMRFLIGNLADFDSGLHVTDFTKLEESDRWILSQLSRLIGEVDDAYDRYEFYRAYHLIYGFCNTQLSAVYLDVIKDRLYCSAPGDDTRRAAQTTINHLLDHMARLLAPVLVFTAEEIWEHTPMGSQSVHLTDFPVAPEAWRDADLEKKWTRLLELRDEVALALEEARRDKSIGHSLDSALEILPRNEAEADFFAENVALLKMLLIVSDVRVSPVAGGQDDGKRISVSPAPGEKCERCWMKDPRVGQDPEHPGLCPRCSDVMRRVDAG
ncbi:class I tRNA ligase family protein, partial [Candidatus Sumerlaeota bacterium]|nr:class I tRNA ligase family protein [Candidatus Sumerlaeota bacterium]